jgi:NTE family protein
MSGGGARAAYQVGVLASIAERRPDIVFPILTGVSAGAINTITLAAHPGNLHAKVTALREEWSRLTAPQVYRVRLSGLTGAAFKWIGQRITGRQAGPTVVRGVMDMEPLRAYLSERVNLAGIDANVRAGRLRAVGLSATCYTTGDTVTFVHGSPDVPMWARAQRRSMRVSLNWDHVLASASIPILFPAIEVGRRVYYGDGSVRQAAPLAPAIHFGGRRLLAIGMRPREERRAVRLEREYPSAAQVMGMLFHSIFLDSLDADEERLERVNALLRGCAPEQRKPTGLSPLKLLVIRPSVDLGAMARPHFHRLPSTMRRIVQGIGGEREGSSDFVSYLLFDPAYTLPLMELGYDDANDQWGVIERFLDEPVERGGL